MFNLPASCFRKLYQKGRTAASGAVVLKQLPNRREYSRFGFVVSTKIAKKAVERNLLRRRAKEITRSFLKEGRIEPGFDFVLIFRRSLNNFPVLKKELEELWSKKLF